MKKADDVPRDLLNAACMIRLEHNPDGTREDMAAFLADLLPVHEAMVRAKASEELTALAEECAPALTGPRGIRRRTLHAAVRHVLPTLTPQQVAEAIADGGAVVIGCPALDEEASET